MSPWLAHAARSAARRLGTPLHLYDMTALRVDAEAVAAAFPDPWLRLYALKANGLPGLIGALPGLGYGASAASRGELVLAERAGFPPARTALEGVGKTPADLTAVIERARRGAPLLWTSLESAEEARDLARRAAQAGLPDRLDVLVRINPVVATDTLRGIPLSARRSKLGVLAEELPGVIAAGGGLEGPLRWRGIRIHVGSQLGAVDAWRSAFRVGLRLVALQQAVLPDFDTLDAGSGFPTAYVPGDDVPPVARFARVADEELDALPAGRRLRLAIEPGRVVVAGCGWLVTRVLHVRQRETTSVVLDGGMTELLGPVLHGAVHPVHALTSRGRLVDQEPGPAGRSPAASAARHGLARVAVHGPLGEAADALGDADLPPLRRGDLVAIGATGAYGSSMASTYHGRPRAAEAAWDGNRLRILRRRGSLSSLA